MLLTKNMENALLPESSWSSKEFPGEIGSSNSSRFSKFSISVSQEARSRLNKHKTVDRNMDEISADLAASKKRSKVRKRVGIIAKNCPHEPTFPVNCLLRLHDLDTRRTRYMIAPQHRVTKCGGGGRVRRALPCKQRTHVFYPRMYARARV